jgi:hypothetical protein
VPETDLILSVFVEHWMGGAGEVWLKGLIDVI